jgi:hypothetical protein
MRCLFCKTPHRGHQRLPTSLRLNLVEDGVENYANWLGNDRVDPIVEKLVNIPSEHKAVD